ncbi:MAG: tetratricopeptide repeat protein [Saprospiraceae bacterium]|nr:tetratricopeptide repeat protein [Saprospiraceae bacterium]
MTRPFFMLFTVVFLASCQSGPDKAAMAQNIKAIQSEIAKDAQPSPEKLVSLQNSLLLYADAFPADSTSVSYLAKAGETARLLQQHDKALEIFDKISKTYPNTKSAAAAMFMKAFTLDNDLKKFDEAKPAYEAFLKQYPNDEFADDAQFLLKNLGKSPEELIKEFEKNAQPE